MVLRRILRMALLIVLAGAASAHAGDKLPLRILYAGASDSDRMRDFVTFLKEHFSEVGTVSAAGFNPHDADKYDVVIFDWTRIQGPGGTLQIPPVSLERSYNRATILIGGLGARIGGTLGLKLDWL